MKVGELFTVLGMDFSQFNKDEAVAKSRVEGLGGTLSGILKNAFSFGLGMSFFSAVQQGFKATVGSALSFNDTMQQARIGFTTMLGGAQRAKTFLADLAKFAAQTPFEFQDLLRASQRMMALGFSADEVRPTLTAVGDAMAAMGKGTEGIDAVILALGQMRMAGRVNAQDMLQLTNAGIGAWEILAEAVGKTVPQTRKLAEQGKIDGRKAAAAITEGMEKRFPGMMKKMEDSWRGVTSTIKDVFRMTLGAMTSELFNSANEWLKKVRDTATGFYDAFQKGGLSYAVSQTFGPQAAAGIQSISTVLRGLWSTVVGVGRTIITNWSVIGPLTMSVVKAFLAFNAARLMVNLTAAAVRNFVAANLAMRGTLLEGPKVLLLISRLIGEYRYQVHQASVAWMMGGPVTVTWLTRIQSAVHSVNLALGKTIWPILAVTAVLLGGVALWNKYTAAMQQASMAASNQKLKDYAKSAAAAASGTNAQADAIGNLGKASKDGIQSFDEVHQIMDQTADASVPGTDTKSKGAGAPEIPDFEMPDFSTLLENAKPTFGGFFRWIRDGASEAFGDMKSKIAGAFQALKDADPIVQGIAAIITTLLLPALIKTGIEATVAAGKAVWGWIVQGLEAAKSVAVQLGHFAVLVGKWAWMGWEAVANAGKVAWAWVLQGLEAAKSVAAQVGQFLIAGARWIWLGIQAGLGAAEVVGAWLLQQAQAIISVAVQVAQFVILGAKWVWMGIVAMANAAKMAAAWFIALGPVGWVTATVVALAALIALKWDWVKEHTISVWGAVSKWLGEKWDGIKSSAQAVWDGIVGVFRSAKDILYAYVVEPFVKAEDFIRGLISKAKEWGRNLIAAFTGGVKSATPAAVQAADDLAQGISDNIGFQSPTEEGPGRYADQWAPNLMRMYTQGILANVSMVRSAAGVVAGSLTSMSAVPAPVFAGMGTGGGFGQGGASPFTSVGGPAPEIHLHVGTLVADKGGLKQLERMLREFRFSEDQRIGQER